MMGTTQQLPVLNGRLKGIESPLSVVQNQLIWDLTDIVVYGDNDGNEKCPACPIRWQGERTWKREEKRRWEGGSGGTSV